MSTVSVIIPTWNRAATVGRAVLSALSQTYQDIEVIVADDGSTDDTRQILEPFSERVHYLPLEHSGLPAVPRNAALRVARGEYVAFLDSDDKWLPEKLERQIAVLEENTEVGLVCSNALVEKGNALPLCPYHSTSYLTTQWTLAKLLKTNIVITSTVVLRQKTLATTGGFSEDPMLRALEDYDLWLRVACQSQAYYLAEPLAIYSDSDVSIRSRQNLANYWLGMLKILENLDRFSPTAAAQQAGIIEEMRIAHTQSLCGAYLSQGLRQQALACGLSIIRARPTDFRGYWQCLKIMLGRAACVLRKAITAQDGKRGSGSLLV